MSKNEKLVLDFSRTIPAPFDDTTKVPRKMTTSATRKTISMHTSTSTQSTLCKSVVKMLLQSFAQKAGNERGGVGTTVVNSKE
ncbi:MAG: hypothetical protein UGF89_12735, partial [Acutalibacteraceae bacterium]|nr:hypothetical protein [Acutalibacteraceae bacterium]